MDTRRPGRGGVLCLSRGDTRARFFPVVDVGGLALPHLQASRLESGRSPLVLREVLLRARDCLHVTVGRTYGGRDYYDPQVLAIITVSFLGSKVAIGR